MKVELEASIKKSQSYEEFLEDMRRKNFEIKEGKHIAFKGENQQRFIRGESISYDFSAEIIRFKIEQREEWQKMEDLKIKRVLDRSTLYGGLYEWASGENGHAEDKSWNYIRDNLLDGEEFEPKIMFYFFLEYYRAKKTIFKIKLWKLTMLTLKCVK